MTERLMRLKGTFILTVCFLVPCRSGLAQFVEVTGELELSQDLEPERTCRFRCVIGTNSWEVEGDFCRNCKQTNWFIGGKLIEHTVVDREASFPPTRMAITPPPVGTKFTRAYEMSDGNPSMPRGIADRLRLHGRIAWLAFCSGPCLKRDGRHLFPPSDLWKQLICGDHFWDRTVTFEDPLGLPKSVTLYTTNQPVVQYRVTSSTNVLGWQIPLEFHLAQYCPAPLPDNPRATFGTNGWELEFVAKGKVLSVGPGAEPRIPPDVLKAARE